VNNYIPIPERTKRMSVKKDEEKGEANKNKEINRRNRKKK
jgi:hypothetical protein